MRCSCGTAARIASLGLNCFLAGRSDACGVCVCVELQAFCIFGLNCLLARRSDAVRAMTLDRHKVVMDITFVAWCEVNIEFAELLFFVKLWMLGFGFDMSERMSADMSESMSEDMSERMAKDMSERMSEDMSERMSKDMSERMSKDMPEDMSERMSKDMSERCQTEYQKICQKEKQKIYQKICQKECQNICPKERQKIASSQSAKLRVTERISGDELYVYPHLTRSGWHKWMWRENFVIDKMETRWAQSMTFGFGFGVFKRRMLNRGRCITGVMRKWNFVRSCWCCCLRRGGGLDAETKRSSSTNWHPILSWIHSQTASLLELDDNPHLTTSTQHVMVGITRSKVIFSFFLVFSPGEKKQQKQKNTSQNMFFCFCFLGVLIGKKYQENICGSLFSLFFASFWCFFGLLYFLFFFLPTLSS